MTRAHRSHCIRKVAEELNQAVNETEATLKSLQQHLLFNAFRSMKKHAELVANLANIDRREPFFLDAVGRKK